MKPSLQSECQFLGRDGWFCTENKPNGLPILHHPCHSVKPEPVYISVCPCGTWSLSSSGGFPLEATEATMAPPSWTVRASVLKTNKQRTLLLVGGKLPAAAGLPPTACTWVLAPRRFTEHFPASARCVVGTPSAFTRALPHPLALPPSAKQTLLHQKGKKKTSFMYSQI